MIRCAIYLFSLPFAISIALAQPKPLQTFEGCKLIPTAWADGDSFEIETAAKVKYTVRLYGVDCMEWHIADESDSRRLRAQRRYFGITDAMPKVLESIEMAKAFGEEAAKKTGELLKRPFKIHTRMRPALGDGKHPRIYAFVETSDGKDLGEELVRCGLARAFGVDADGPGERSKEENEAVLKDLELQAAIRRIGIWSKTDSDKLPTLRSEQRKEEEEDEMAQGNDRLPADFRCDPNTAPRDVLDRLPGIGETKANEIIEEREEEPFKKAEDLMRVYGIKRRTLDKFQQYLEFKVP